VLRTKVGDPVADVSMTVLETINEELGAADVA
jgi:hypothetical protein